MTEFEFIPLKEEHIPLMRRWLKEPHVAEFWQESEDENEFREKFLHKLLQRGVSPFIIEIDGKPIGYIQHYEADKVGGGWWPDAKSGTFGIDQFIGESEFVGRGVGTEVIKHFTNQLFKNRSVLEVITDPDPRNARTIRAYEKVGFKKVAEVTTPGGAAILMSLPRSDREMSDE